MPVEVRIDRELRSVHVTFEGVLSVDQMREYLAGTWATGQLEGFSELADVRGVDADQLSFGRLLKLAQEAPGMGMRQRPARLAVVVSSAEQLEKALFFGSAREVLRPYAEDFRTFSSVEEAKQWLADPAVPLDDLEP